jgi:hypothetical protein
MDRYTENRTETAVFYKTDSDVGIRKPKNTEYRTKNTDISFFSVLFDHKSMAISYCGRRYFSVESWLRKANVDESAECATVGPAVRVSR